MLKIPILVHSILVDPTRECLFTPPDAVEIRERARCFDDIKPFHVVGMIFWDNILGRKFVMIIYINKLLIGPKQGFSQFAS